jgi:hypothetical protein
MIKKAQALKMCGQIQSKKWPEQEQDSCLANEKSAAM